MAGTDGSVKTEAHKQGSLPPCAGSPDDFFTRMGFRVRRGFASTLLKKPQAVCFKQT